MKIIVIIGILLIVLYVLFSRVIMVITGGEKRIEGHKKNLEYLTLENYVLIRESPYSDKLSKYTIKREEHSLKFRGEAAFFVLTAYPTENTIKLRDLSTHGLREAEFLRYICNLIDKIIEKNNQIKNENSN